MSTFGERLKIFRESKGYDTQGKFAKRVKISPSTISSYENGAVTPGYDKIALIKEAFPDADINYLITGIEKHENKGKTTLHEPNTQYGVDVAASNKVDINSGNSLRKLPLLTMNKLARLRTKADILAYAQIQIIDENYAILPEHNYCDLFVEIDGDAMDPTFEPLEKVAVRLKLNTKYIEAGRAYILNIMGDLVIRRVFETENPEKVLLVADNENYPPQIIERSWIEYMLTVHAIVKGNTGKRLAA